MICHKTEMQLEGEKIFRGHVFALYRCLVCDSRVAVSPGLTVFCCEEMVLLAIEPQEGEQIYSYQCPVCDRKVKIAPEPSYLSVAADGESHHWGGPIFADIIGNVTEAGITNVQQLWDEFEKLLE